MESDQVHKFHCALERQGSREMGMKASFIPGLGIGMIVACFKEYESFCSVSDLLKRVRMVGLSAGGVCLSL